MADSIKLGELLSYTLVYKHSSKQEVFFPDKSYNYEPFELVNKTYFPTNTKNGISIDTAIYQLRTFNISKTQALSLPIYLLKNGDSTLIFSEKDSVYLINEIKGNLAKLKLKDKATLLPMKMKVNIAYIFLQLVIASIAIFIWWLIFGKTVLAQIKLFRIYRRHSEFKSNLNKFTKVNSKTNIEKGLLLWKKYMSRLQKMPFNTMTTPEIFENIPNENLEEALKEVDKSIYGNSVSPNLNNSFLVLENIANQYYQLKKKEIISTKK